jgi:hypothetical protein
MTLTVDTSPAAESPLDSSGHVIAQFLRSLQRSLDPDDLHFASRDLSGRFVVASRSRQAALMAGRHSPKKECRKSKWNPHRQISGGELREM